jgi:hypothetical protein
LCARWDWRNVTAFDFLQRVFLGNPFLPPVNTS